MPIHVLIMHRLLSLTSCDISCHLYSFDTRIPFYTCLSCLAYFNGATLGVKGEDLDATTQEVVVEEETPQQLLEWVLKDVF